MRSQLADPPHPPTCLTHSPTPHPIPPYTRVGHAIVAHHAALGTLPAPLARPHRPHRPFTQPSRACSSTPSPRESGGGVSPSDALGVGDADGAFVDPCVNASDTFHFFADAPGMWGRGGDELAN